MTRAAAALLVVALGACTALHEAGEAVHVGVSVSAPTDWRVYARAPLWLGVELGELDGVHAFGSDFGAAHAWTDTGAGLAVFGGTRRTASKADRPYVDEVHLLASVPLTDTRAPFVVPTRVEVGAHLAVVGASLGVDPVQLVDALAACVGYDLLGDDPGSPGAPPVAPHASTAPT